MLPDAGDNIRLAPNSSIEYIWSSFSNLSPENDFSRADMNFV
jgi:hypothetical protein